LWNGHSCSAYAIDVDDTASIAVSSAIDETVAVEDTAFAGWSSDEGLLMYSLNSFSSDPELSVAWWTVVHIFGEVSYHLIVVVANKLIIATSSVCSRSAPQDTLSIFFINL
jgi:hypothetical protein